jgi:hypothetical protein
MKLRFSNEFKDNIICDKCEQKCDISKDLYGAEINFQAGYYSQYFLDGEQFQVHICEKCLYEFIETFKNKPLKWMEE